MNHKHKAEDLFPEWYSSISPTVDETTVSVRVAGIRKLLTNNSLAFWVDVARIAWNVDGANEETVALLVNTFKENDINFPLNSNENLLRVLSQILLCFVFESNHELSGQIALAVQNIAFSKKQKGDKVPFYQYACEQVALGDADGKSNHQETRKAVDDALESMENGADDEQLMDYTDQVALIKTVQYLYDETVKQQQETNVLWWLFGEYCTPYQAFFTKIGWKKMVAASAFELSELASTKLPAAKYIIHKALVLSNGGKAISKKISLATVIDETDQEVKSKVLSAISGISSATPCLLAFELSNQFDNDKTVWKTALNSKISDLDINREMAGVELAYQIYNELIFLAHD